MSLRIADQQSPQELIGINNDTMTQIIYEIFYLKRKESTVAKKIWSWSLESEASACII